MNSKIPLLFLVAFLFSPVHSLLAQSSSSAKGSDDSKTTVHFSMAPDSPDQKVLIRQVLSEYSISGNYGIAASGAHTALVSYAPGTIVLENGPYEFNAGFGQYGNFIVDASGGVQNWEISTKSKVLHNALFWGGAGVSLVGCIAALATLNSTGNTAMDFALIGGVGGLAVMSIGVLVPPIRIRQE